MVVTKGDEEGPTPAEGKWSEMLRSIDKMT